MKNKRNIMSKIVGAALSLCLCAGMAAGPMSMTAHADEYTYQATIYAGNHGQLTSGVNITVNNRVSGSSYYIDRSADKIVIRGLCKGDRVSVDVLSAGAVQMEPGSLYYVKGLRDSGLDNAEAGYGSFRVERDQDFVIAYGMRTEQTSYTVYYRSLDGRDLAPAQTYYGNVGDKPVAAYLYVEGYTPLSYNITKTLSENPADNAMTFLYKESEGATVTVTVPGETNYIHIPGGTYTVNVPGPTIVQTVPSTSNGNTGGNGNSGYGDGTNSNPGGNGDANANNGQGNSGNNQDQGAGNNQGTSGENQGTGNQNQGTAGDNQNQGTGNNQGTGSQDQGTGSLDQGTGGQDQGAAGDNQNQGTGDGQGNASVPGQGTDLQGTGVHGNRGDGQTGGDNTGSNGGNGGNADNGGNSAYKPGGSLDVVISNDYQPSEILDLDSNPSGVPMGEAPGGIDDGMNAGQDGNNGNTGDNGDMNDAAQDGMNENTGNSGTGQIEPEKSGFPIVPVAIGAVVVLGAAAAIILVVYKKQRAGGDPDGEDDG